MTRSGRQRVALLVVRAISSLLALVALVNFLYYVTIADLEGAIVSLTAVVLFVFIASEL